MSLKRWAVRQISNLLSDYLEGVTEQNLQASLNLSVGEVEVRGVHLRPGLLTEHRLGLLSSDLSVSARIPWRNLGSEPTVITVSDVWVEARARIPGEALSPAESEEALRRRRARRAHETQALLDARLLARSTDNSCQGESTPAPGAGEPKQSFGTRLAHAAVRLLQIRITCLHIRLVSADGTTPLNICCQRFALDEGAAGGKSSGKMKPDPKEALGVDPDADVEVGNLSKVLELKGFAAYLGHAPGRGARSEAEELSESQWEAMRAALVARQKEVESARNKVLTARWLDDYSRLKTQLREAALSKQTRMAGPLSVSAQVSHLVGEVGLLRLQAEMHVDRGASVVWISPALVRNACQCVDWWLAVSNAPGNQSPAPEELPLEEYIELFSKQLRSEPFDAERLQAIEDMAPVWWLCRVQMQCHEKMSTEAMGRRRAGLVGWLRRRVSSGPECQDVAAAAVGGTSEHSMRSSSVATVDEDAPSLDTSLLEAADALLPDLQRPRRLEVLCSIPPCVIVQCSLDSSSRSKRAHQERRAKGILTVEGGVNGRASLLASTWSDDFAAILHAPWDARLKADLVSLNILLDQEPLMILQVDDSENFEEAFEDWEEMEASKDANSPDATDEGTSEPDSADEEPFAQLTFTRKGSRKSTFQEAEDFEDSSEEFGSMPCTPLPTPMRKQESIGDKGSPAGGADQPSQSVSAAEPAVSLTVACTHRGGGVLADHTGFPGELSMPSPPPRWMLQVHLKQEPFRFLLSPWSVRTVVDLAATLKHAADNTQNRYFNPAASCDSTGMSSTNTSFFRACDAQGDSVASDAGQSSSPAAWFGLSEEDTQPEEAPFLITLDLSMAAPVLTWSVPSGQMSIALGRLLMRTCSCVPPPTRLSSPEVCPWTQLSCICQLADTSFMVRVGDVEEWVYEPSTIAVRFWRSGCQAEAGTSGSGENGRDADWLVAVESSVVRWRAGLCLLQVAGELRPSLDYALSPLAGLVSPQNGGESVALGGGISSTITRFAANSQSSGYVHRAVSEPELHSHTLLRIQVALERFELQVNVRPSEGRCMTLVCMGITGEYNVHNGHVDAAGRFKKAELLHENFVVVTNADGASLRIINANHHVSAALDSSRISVQWHGVHMAGMVAAGKEAAQRLADGWESASKALSMDAEEAANPRGIEALLRQRLSQSLMQRRANLIEDQQFEQEEDEPPLIALERKASSGLPAPRGKCSVHLRVHCEGVTAYLLTGPPQEAGSREPCSVASLIGAEAELRVFRSGDGTAQVSLLGVELHLAKRRILAPRHAGKLLHIKAIRFPAPYRAMYIAATWAQVCLLFRQCDLDTMRFQWQTCIAIAFSTSKEAACQQDRPQKGANERAKPAAVGTSKPEASALAKQQQAATSHAMSRSGSAGSAGGGIASAALSAGGSAEATPAASGPTERPLTVHFTLDVGAPRVFLPTDRAAVHGREPHGQGELVADATSGEPTFWPKAGDGFLVFDFGHFAASGESADEMSVIKLNLRGLHLSGASPDEGDVLRDIIWPLNLDAELDSSSFNATSAPNKDSTEPPRHRLSLTRPQLTLILDVLAENLGYLGRSALRNRPALSEGALPSSTQGAPAGDDAKSQPVCAEPSEKGDAADESPRGFRFSWRWTGELTLDVAYTDAVPLAKFRLARGLILMESSNVRSAYIVWCAGFSAIDTRTDARNVNKEVIEMSSSNDSKPSFQVLVESPAIGNAKTCVEFKQPRFNVLPQLVMDVFGAGLSAWQQCTYRNDPSPMVEDLSKEEEDNRTHTVEVKCTSGVFRVAARWSEPTAGYFDFGGSLIITIVSHAKGLTIENFDLRGGSLQLALSQREQPTMICTHLEWSIRGEQCRHDVGTMRQSLLELHQVTLQPYAIRMSMADHQALAEALMELFTMDADPAEPADEVARRDPVSLTVDTRFAITVSINVCSAQLEILDQVGGQAWPGIVLKAQCPLWHANLEFRPNSAPIVNAAANMLELGLWAHNHRLGKWDPVAPSLKLRIMHHAQRQPQSGPRDSVSENIMEVLSPLTIMLSASLVHLARRIFKSTSQDLRYGYLFAGLNVTGHACRVTAEDGRTCLLPAAPHLQPLEMLLTGGDLALQPQLLVSLADFPEARPCEVSLRRESSVLWDSVEQGVFVCRLTMPRPPQRVLMITSTVCIRNHSMADLELRFLVQSNDPFGLDPAVPLELDTACHVSDVAYLDADGLALATAKTATEDGRSSPLATIAGEIGSQAGAEPTDAFQLKAGQFMAAPAQAQIARGVVFFQVRPGVQATGSLKYEWCDAFCSVPAPGSTTTAVTLCSKPPQEIGAELPPHWVHLRSMSRGQEGAAVDCRDVDIQAPFKLVNACPCDIFCCLAPAMSKKLLGVDRCVGSPCITVLDGCGGEVVVPAIIGAETEVCPLRLDSGGYFHWINGERRERTKPRWPHTNCVWVKRGPRGLLEWHCFHAVVNHVDPNNVIRIPRQKSIPVYDCADEDIRVSVQLMDTTSRRSAWSLPIRVGDGAAQRPAEETVEVRHKDLTMFLKAQHRGRELVISARCWFVNSTGEDVILHPPNWSKKEHAAVPLFGDGISFLPEAQNSDGDSVAILELRGSSSPVTARVPDLGGVEELHISPLHKCCLLTEAVALPGSLSSVPCRLVSLVPAMMIFNRCDYSIGFRQYKPSGGVSTNVHWLHPGMSATFWWVFDVHPKQLQFCARHMTDPSNCNRASTWSPPLEVSKATVGAYPLVLRYGLAERCLVCISIDESMSVVSVTVHSSLSCHQLVNRHPDLVIHTGSTEQGVPREQEELVEFSAYHGHSVPFACRQPFRVRKIQLTLRVSEQASRSDKCRGEAVLHVDLDRFGTYSLLPRQRRMPAGCLLRTSTLENVGALITVEIQERVAVVTVQAVASSANHEVGMRTLNVVVSIPQLSVALISELAQPPAPATGLRRMSTLSRSRPRLTARDDDGGATPTSQTNHTVGARVEVFTLNLVDTRLQLERRPDRSHHADFQVDTIQVDMRYPKKDVVLASTSKPFLHVATARDDCSMLDIHIRNARMDVGDLEVSMSQVVWEQISALSQNIAPGAGGLALDEVLGRAGMPYHFSCRSTRPSTAKLVVWNLTVSQVKANIWWTIYLPQAHYIPDTLRVMIAIVSFGVAELDVKGAEVKVPEQQAFSEKNRGEGSFGAVFEQALRLYQPHLKACWKSLLKDSNVFMGGLVSRSLWAPRERRVKHLREPASTNWCSSQEPSWR